MPTTTYIRGPESTENIPSARRVRDVADRMALLDPDIAPLVQLLTTARKRDCFNTKFEWIEKGLPDRWSKTTAAYTAGDTNLGVDQSKKFSIGDVILVPRTGERMRVTAVNDGSNVITVTRAVGGTTAAALNNNEDLLIIGNAYPEGSRSGVVKSHTEVYPYNYTQIVRTPLEVTGSEAASENYTGPDRNRLRSEKAKEHKLSLEYTALFGSRGIDTSDTAKPIRYTGGVFFFLDQSGSGAVKKDAGGILTEPEVEQFCEQIFAHTGGGNTRLLLCAAGVVSVLDQLAMGRIQLVPSDRTYGITVKQWVTGHGTLLIVEDRLLEWGLSGSNGYGGHAIALAPEKLTYRYLRGRDTKLLIDVHDNDYDGFKDEYFTECGWQIENPELHGYMYNITG